MGLATTFCVVDVTNLTGLKLLVHCSHGTVYISWRNFRLVYDVQLLAIPHHLSHILPFIWIQAYMV